MPQMTAQTTFVAAAAPQALSLPLAALTPADGGHTVRVLQAGGGIETRRVRVGVRSRHLAQVLGGLQEGEQVITGERSVPGLRSIQW